MLEYILKIARVLQKLRSLDPSNTSFATAFACFCKLVNHTEITDIINFNDSLRVTKRACYDIRTKVQLSTGTGIVAIKTSKVKADESATSNRVYYSVAEHSNLINHLAENSPASTHLAGG
jgi:hypothetical protein